MAAYGNSLHEFKRLACERSFMVGVSPDLGPSVISAL